MGRRGEIALDPRLSMIARMVGSCACCADIGCDHGRLGAFLLQTGQCKALQMTDISGPSLDKARALMDNLDMADRVRFSVGDGLLALEGTPDVIVIAGMGGATIAQILENGREKLGRVRLVLQPNVAAPQLRRTLCALDYAVTDEQVVQDGRRCYVVIQAEPGKADYSQKQLTVGPVLLERMPRALEPYAAFRLRVARKALAGALASEDDSQQAPLEREIAIWEEVWTCLQR